MLAHHLPYPVGFKCLLWYYSDNPLFHYFVYPWISKDTLLNASEHSIPFSEHLSSYLHECTKAVNTFDPLGPPEHLFIWQDIRTESEDAKALCEFLADKFGWPWLDKAKIQKRGGQVIEIEGTGYRHVLIRLSDNREKATVSYKGKEQIELPVCESLSSHYELMVGKPRQLDESCMKDFAKDHCRVVRQLIFSILSDDSIDSDTLRILVQDNTFPEALEDIKTQFVHRCNLFDSVIET